MSTTPTITPTPVGAGDGKSDMEILNGGSPAPAPDDTPAAPSEPPVTPAAPEPTSAPAAPAEPAAPSQPQPDKPVAVGESMPEALRRASAADPAVRAEINRVWAQVQNYAQLGPVAELKALKDKFPGGVAEAEAILNDALGIQDVDNAFYRGTPEQRTELAGNLQKDDPAAFVGMTEASLSVLQKADPQGYQQISDGFIKDQLLNGAIGGHIQKMMDLVTEGKDPTQLVKDLYNWAAEKAGITKPAPDPRQAELDRQRADIERQRNDFNSQQLQSYQQSFNTTVMSQVGTEVDGVLNPLLEAAPVSEKAKELIKDTIMDQLEESLKKDNTLQYQLQQIDSLRRYDDATKAQRVKLTVDRAKVYLPEIARTVFNEWTTNIIGTNKAQLDKRTAVASKKDVVGGGGGSERRQPAPRPGDVDYSKTSDADILSGNITRRA